MVNGGRGRPVAAARRSPATMRGAQTWKISSSSDTIAWQLPGSPWRAQRPISCRSTRRESWYSVRITCSPPRSATPVQSSMSVPRPAMLVATVMRPGSPACATTSASSWSCFAFSSACTRARCHSTALICSEASTERVPISTGRRSPRANASATSATRSHRDVFAHRRCGGGVDQHARGAAGQCDRQRHPQRDHDLHVIVVHASLQHVVADAQTVINGTIRDALLKILNS